RDRVRTVAYIPVEASGGAALVALACEQLVMQPGAHVGGMPVVPVDPRAAPDGEANLDPVKDTIRESLAAKTGRPWSLLVAVVDPSAELFRYSNTQTAETRLMS